MYWTSILISEGAKVGSSASHTLSLYLSPVLVAFKLSELIYENILQKKNCLLSLKVKNTKRIKKFDSTSLFTWKGDFLNFISEGVFIKITHH